MATPSKTRLRLQSCSGAPDFSAEEHSSGSCPVRLLPVRQSDSHDPYDVGVRHAQLCGTVSLPCQQPIQTQTEKGKCGQTYKMSYLVKAGSAPDFSAEEHPNWWRSVHLLPATKLPTTDPNPG